MDFLRFTGPLLLLLICFSKQSYADLFSATQHYQQQNFSKAYEEFLQLSEFGNSDAMGIGGSQKNQCCFGGTPVIIYAPLIAMESRIAMMRNPKASTSMLI